MITVRKANVDEIVEFITHCGADKRLLPDYLEPVLNVVTIRTLLRNKLFKRNRKAFLAYIGNRKVGYCIVNYLPEESIVDLLYVSDHFRRQGVAQQLITFSETNSVVVNKANVEAVSLYTKMNLNIDFDDIHDDFRGSDDDVYV